MPVVWLCIVLLLPSDEPAEVGEGQVGRPVVGGIVGCPPDSQLPRPVRTVGEVGKQVAAVAREGEAEVAEEGPGAKCGSR